METTKGYFISDMLVMLNRSLKHIMRSSDTIITTAIMPIAIMLLFVYVLGGAIEAGTDNYVSYQLPGILLITVANGVAYTSYRLATDKQKGIFERFHSLPIGRSTPLWGHVMTSVISNLISIVVVIAVAFLLGFRTQANMLSWLMVFGVLILFTLSLTWISVIAGIKAKTPDSAGVFSYPLLFLPFLSSAFVPAETMPFGLRIFVENQPVTFVVNTIRGLFENTLLISNVVFSLIWCVTILLLSYFVAMRLYKKIM